MHFIILVLTIAFLGAESARAEADCGFSFSLPAKKIERSAGTSYFSYAELSSLGNGNPFLVEIGYDDTPENVRTALKVINRSGLTLDNAEQGTLRIYSDSYRLDSAAERLFDALGEMNGFIINAEVLEPRLTEYGRLKEFGASFESANNLQKWQRMKRYRDLSKKFSDIYGIPVREIRNYYRLSLVDRSMDLLKIVSLIRALEDAYDPRDYN
jgi:hypothetical protein